MNLNEKVNNKLGLGIVCFDASEHLYNIISEIRDLVDYVVVGLQSKSYIGEYIDLNDVFEVETLQKEGLVDEILYINDLDSTLFPRVQETIKRNRILDNIKEHGCNYQLIIDSDEFYTHNSFEKAKNYVYNNNIEMSYCRYVNYYHDYEHYLVYPFKDGNYVPFIAKTDYRFEWQCRDFPKPSDPTRRYVRPKTYKIDPKTGKAAKNKDGDLIIDKYLVDYYEFPWQDLKMHHLSWIRANIRKKLNSWSSKSYFDDYHSLIDRAVERYDNFSDDNINEQAILLFNTPGNKVDIQKFPRQYIHPKVDYRTRVHNLPTEKRIDFIDMYNYKNKGCADVLKSLRIINADGKVETSKMSEYFVFYKDFNIDDYHIADVSFRSIIKNVIDNAHDDSVIYKSGESVIIFSKQTLRKIIVTLDNKHIIQPTRCTDMVNFILKIMDMYFEENKLNKERYIKKL